MTTFVGLDIETTGLFKPGERIIEVYAGLWDDRGYLLDHYETRIQPMKAIAIEAQRVHGISGSDLVGCPVWDAVADAFAAFVHRGDVIVAHNGAGFDMPFINAELERIGRAKVTLPCFDTMIEGRWATPEGRVPSLQALCFACGVDYDTTKAHAAAYDVHVLLECFFYGKTWKFFKPPEVTSHKIAA